MTDHFAKWRVLLVGALAAVAPGALAQQSTAQDSAAVVMKALGADLVRIAPHMPIIMSNLLCASWPNRQGAPDTSSGSGEALLRALGTTPGIRIMADPPDSLAVYRVCVPSFAGDSAQVRVIVNGPMGPLALAHSRPRKGYRSESITDFTLRREGREWKVTRAFTPHIYDFVSNGLPPDSTDSLRHTPPTHSPRRETPYPSPLAPPPSARR